MAIENHASEEAGVSLPPRENIVRAIMPGVELRAAEDGNGKTLRGHFSVFNEWTEIRSIWEGNFMERIAPGAFKKTFQENARNIKVLFDHGHDPSIGNKPLGPIRSLEEDELGARYEVDLLDTSYNRDLLPGLEAGLYGASFRFRVMREDINDDPGASDHNPAGLPERTIKEVSVAEFGPVTFPAYAGAPAGIRSLSDEYVLGRFVREPERFVELLETMRAGIALPGVGAGHGHSGEGSREVPKAPRPPISDDEWRRLLGAAPVTRSDTPSWLSRT